MLDDFSVELGKIAARPGLILKPSKDNPRVRRWQRISPKQRTERAGKLSKPVRVGIGLFSGALLGIGTAMAVRGHRIRQLERLAPKFVTQNKKQFMSMLEPGDLLLIQMKEMKNPLSRSGAKEGIARYVFRGSQGDMVHAALYTGSGKIMHAAPRTKTGVLEDLTEHYLKGKHNILVIRPGQKGQQIANIAEATKDSYRYKLGIAERIGASELLPNVLTKTWFPIKDGRIICSTMTADIMAKAGVALPKKPGKMLTVDFRTLSNPPVLHFKAERGMLKTSPVVGAGWVIPGMALAGVSTTGKYPLQKTAGRGELTRHILKRVGLPRLGNWQHAMRKKMVDKVMRKIPASHPTTRGRKLIAKNPKMDPTPGRTTKRKHIRAALESPDLHPAFHASMPGTMWYPAAREAATRAAGVPQYGALAEFKRSAPGLTKKLQGMESKASGYLQKLRTPRAIVGRSPGTG